MSPRISSGSLPVFASVLVLISSACCIGPLAVVLSFVGLTSGTMLAVENVVGPFRPLILSATVLFLGVGFYAAYRKQEMDCEDGRVCAKPASRRLQRVLLWVATALFLTLLYFTYIHPNLDVLFGIY